MRRNVLKPSGSREGRRGAVMFTALIALVFLFLLALYLLNNAAIVAAKVHVQDTADAVAASAAVWDARGLNASASADVLMGQGIGLAAVHTAIAGRDVDGRDLSASDRRRNDRDVR